jgi:hypothetical protein
MPAKNQGYLEINHSGGIGLPEGYAQRHYGVSARETLHIERDTYTCGHCSGVVAMHPLRTRERETCWPCNRWICDACGWTRKTFEPGKCRNINVLVDRLQSLDPSDMVAIEVLLADHQNFMLMRAKYDG